MWFELKGKRLERCTSEGCGELIKAGYADRNSGFAFLTSEGVRLALAKFNEQR